MIKNVKKNGFVLLETVFYIIFFVILSLVVINAMLTMTKAFKETSIQAELVQSGNIMERISREIRQANGINTISTSDLKLNTTNDAGAAKTVEFLLSGSNVQLVENSLLTGDLNALNITVTALTFTQITSAKGTAVKIFLTVQSTDDTQNRTQDFYDTVVLRGVY